MMPPSISLPINLLPRIGFRRGELIALDEDDCDFENNKLRIDESISSTKNGQADITDTKNEASNDM